MSGQKIRENSRKTVVSAKNVAKTFRLPKEHSTELKQAFINRLRGIKGYTDLNVLRDISFEVKEGDFFGIVGRNGSGKSTLLKLLAGIYQPTKGTIKTEGKIVPFIELGVGFNPELTGRENVYMNGAMLGFSNAEVDEMYDEIVDFAELPDFMDQKLKNYSSGMQVRLAFSIAIKAQGDILILDEVLAVGDEAFQRKCNDFFQRIKRDRTKTVILVTHDMGAVQKYATKAIMIKDGDIVAVGDPNKVASLYTEQNDIAYTQSIKDEEEKNDRLQKIQNKEAPYDLKILNREGIEEKVFRENDTMKISVRWSDDNIKNIGIALLDSNNQDIFSTNTFREKVDLMGSKEVIYEVKLALGHGSYKMNSAAFGKNDMEVIAKKLGEPNFVIKKGVDNKNFGGIALLDHEWLVK